MSAGRFLISRYESTELQVGGNPAILPIRVQPESTLFAAGTANLPPTGATTLPVYAKVSKTRREFGISPRKVVLSWVTDTNGIPQPPATYSGDDITIPVLTQAAYNAYVPGTTGTYLGTGVVVKARIPEQVR